MGGRPSPGLGAGLTLTLFALSTWWLIRDAKIEHLERALRGHAERETGRTARAFDWARVEVDMVASLSLAEPRDLMLLIQEPPGETVYRSRHWPAELDPARLPWPQPAEAGDERRPRPRPVTAVALNLRSLADEMRGIRLAYLLTVPLVLSLISLGAWLFSRRALEPIRRLTLATRRVTAAGLDQRLSPAGNDREFAELIDVFNGMLERLERSFQQARRFSADAAHELKTPLTILQGQLELAIQQAETGSRHQAELSAILDQVRRLSSLSRKLLLLSKADAGCLELQRESVDLSQMLNNLVEDARMLAPDLRVTSDLRATLDAGLVQQLLRNLLTNAIKYNLPAGWVRVEAQTQGGQVLIRVSNACFGIPPQERERIFDRFYRARQVAKSKVEGMGLGLALSREIARTHGGELWVEEIPGGIGFVCRLPR